MTKSDNCVIDQYCDTGALFRDQFDNPYVIIRDDSQTRVLPIDGKDLKDYVIRRQYEQNRSIIADKNYRNILKLMGAYAGQNPKHPLTRRVAVADNNKFYYNLCNKRNIVEIIPGKWSIIEQQSPTFRESLSLAEQVSPCSNSNNVRSVSDFCNMRNPADQLLLEAYVHSCFIPQIQHPIAVFYGAQGAAKTTAAHLIKKLVDPSQMALSVPPATVDNLAVELANNYMTVFDNLSHLPEGQSNILCQAVTGGTYVKRKLYSNGDLTQLDIQGCVVLTGINLVVQKHDLLDRVMLFELDRIDEAMRISDRDFWADFEEARPALLASIFDTVAAAMVLHPQIQVPSSQKKSRLVDFYKWGLAITEALGRNREDFISAFAEHEGKKTSQALASDSFSEVLIDFMEQQHEWEGRISDLFRELLLISNGRPIPKAANKLSQVLKQMEPTLSRIGIVLTFKTSSNNCSIVSISMI